MRWQWVGFFLLLSVLLILSPETAAAESFSADSVLRVADSLLAAGELDRAESLYLDLQKGGEPLAWRGLGFIRLKRENWGEAKDAFEKLLRSGADSTAAHYGLAVAHREIGARSAGLIRATHWSYAEGHFKKAVAADSAYRDLLFQYALLERYRGRYFRATDLGLRQLALNPSDEVIFGLFSLYDYLLEHNAPDTVEGYLLGGTSAYSRYFLGELYRRHGYVELADSIFRSLLDETLPFPKQPVLLSLARLHYVAGDPLLADEYYWQAVRSVNSELAARFVFEDLKYILSEAEWAEYRRAKTPREKIVFFRRFWEKRNPRPGCPDNLRIREHYRRLVYAEQQFRYDGFRLPVNDPDVAGYLRFPATFRLNDKLNDKGLVYLRYGEPDRKATSLGADIAHNESWLYRVPGLDHPLMFHFEIDEDGGPNNWRLVPVPTDDRMLASREDWDPRITRYLRSSRMTRDELRNELATLGQEDVMIGLRHDRHTWSARMKPFRCPFTVASFRGERGRTDLNLFFSIPADLPSTGGQVDSLWEFGAAVYDLTWDVEATSRRIVQLDWSDSSTRQYGYIGSHRFSLMPGRHRLGFYAESLNEHLIAGYKFTISVAHYPPRHTALSDILLGREATGDAPYVWRRGGAELVPNPSRRFSKGEPLWVYFEVYNLKRDESGIGRYAVELQIEPLQVKVERSLSNLFGLLGPAKKTVVVTRAERTVTSPDAFEFLALDVGERWAGSYRLRVTVEDLVGGEKDTSSCEFEIE